MTTKPNDATLKPSEWVNCYCEHNDCSRNDGILAYLDEQHAAGRGEPSGKRLPATEGYWNIYSRKKNGDYEWGLHSGPFTEAMIEKKVQELTDNRPLWEFKSKFMSAAEAKPERETKPGDISLMREPGELFREEPRDGACKACGRLETVRVGSDRFCSDCRGIRNLGLYGQSNKCRACGQMLELGNFRIADGCPCNAARGVNHGLVPILTCTCDACDPNQTGSTRYWELTAPVAEPPSPVAGERQPKPCLAACCCVACAPYWPRSTVEVAQAALSQLATVEAERDSYKFDAEYNVSLKELREAKRQYEERDEELQKLDDVVRELGGDHEQGPSAFIRATQSALAEANARVGRLEAVTRLALLAELQMLADTKKWVAAGELSKEAAWGRAFQAAMKELRAKYESPEQAGEPVASERATVVGSATELARFKTAEDSASELFKSVDYYLPKPLPGQAILERAHASLGELRLRAEKLAGTK